MGLTPGTLVCTLFALLLYVLKSLLLVFWGLTPGPLVHTIFRGFPLHSEDSVAGVFASGIFTPIGVESNSFQYFCAQIEVWYLPSKFQIQFYIFLRYSLILRPRRLQPLRFVLQYDPSRSNG